MVVDGITVNVMEDFNQVFVRINMDSFESLLEKAAASILLLIVSQRIAYKKALKSFFETFIDV